MKQASVIRTLSIVALALLAMKVSTPKFFVNNTESMERGLYLVTGNKELKEGDIVVVKLPERLKAFATTHQWLSPEAPLLKRVAALTGREVCFEEKSLFIDDRPVAKIREIETKSESVTKFIGCVRITENELIALGDSERSFDSRYFGALPRNLVIGKARLIYKF